MSECFPSGDYLAVRASEDRLAGIAHVGDEAIVIPSVELSRSRLLLPQIVEFGIAEMGDSAASGLPKLTVAADGLVDSSRGVLKRSHPRGDWEQIELSDSISERSQLSITIVRTGEPSRAAKCASEVPR